MISNESKIKTVALDDIFVLSELGLQDLPIQSGIVMSGNVFHNNINDLINKFDADIFRLKEARIFLLRKGTIKYLLNFEEYMLEGYS